MRFSQQCIVWINHAESVSIFFVIICCCQRSTTSFLLNYFLPSKTQHIALFFLFFWSFFKSRPSVPYYWSVGWVVCYKTSKVKPMLVILLIANFSSSLQFLIYFNVLQSRVSIQHSTLNSQAWQLHGDLLKSICELLFCFCCSYSGKTFTTTHHRTFFPLAVAALTMPTVCRWCCGATDTFRIPTATHPATKPPIHHHGHLWRCYIPYCSDE